MVIANRLEFRDGIATGRLLEPVIRPRGVFARITGAGPDGARRTSALVAGDLGCRAFESVARVRSYRRSGRSPSLTRPIVYFDGARHAEPLSVRKALPERTSC